MTMSPEQQASIERWMVRRGIPHFIAEYSASRDVLTRAAPLLTLVFVVEVIGAANTEWAWWANTLSVAGGLAILIGAWAVANALRKRPLLGRPDRVGVPELAVFVLVPPLLPAIFGGDLADAAWVALANLGLLAAIYFGTSYGVLPMLRWAVGRLFRQLGETLALFTRGLPLLLLAFIFLFINAEVWQVASTMGDTHLAGVMGLFFGLGAVFIVTRLPRELRPLSEFRSAEEITRLAADSPAAGLHALRPDPPPLSRRQWGNAGLVVLFTQGLRVLFASALMGGFLVVFGMLAMQPATIASWTQVEVEVVATLGDFVVTAELLRVAAFLAGFSGFYFTVYLVTDPTFREEFFEDVEGELREAMAVRAVYLGALG